MLPFLGCHAASPSNRRKTGRVSTEGLTCDKGHVMDMSQQGARIISRFPWKEGDRRDITLRGANIRVSIGARCIWRRRERFMRYVVGLAFEDIGADQSAGLNALARVYAAQHLLHEPTAERQAA